MSGEFISMDWDRLAHLPPADRIRRATELQEVGNDIKKRLAQVSSDAVKELIDGGMTRVEVAAELGITVQRVGQLLGSEARPDGIDTGRLRLLAQTLLDHVPLNRTERLQTQEARRMLSRPGRLSTLEARGTAARLAYIGRKLTDEAVQGVPREIREEFHEAVAHAERAYRA